MAEKEKLAVHVGHVKADYNYGSQVFEYGIVTIDAQSRVRNCSDLYPETADFYDLRFRCQVSKGIDELKPFAYSCEYRGVYSVGLREAERMIRVLRKIAKAEDKFLVRPTTFGQYVSMLARALGITEVVQDGQGNGWHDETEHVFWKLSDCQYVIDAQIATFLAEHGERINESTR